MIGCSLKHFRGGGEKNRCLEMAALISNDRISSDYRSCFVKVAVLPTGNLPLPIFSGFPRRWVSCDNERNAFISSLASVFFPPSSPSAITAVPQRAHNGGRRSGQKRIFQTAPFIWDCGRRHQDPECLQWIFDIISFDRIAHTATEVTRVLLMVKPSSEIFDATKLSTGEC